MSAAPTCRNPERFGYTEPSLPGPETHEHAHRKRSQRGLRVSMRKVGLGSQAALRRIPAPYPAFGGGATAVRASTPEVTRK